MAGGKDELLLRKLEDGLRKARGRPAFLGFLDESQQATLKEALTYRREAAPLFWGGLVAVGLAAPLVLERFLTHGNARTQLLWAAGCLLAGGLALRLIAVGLAAYDVTQMPELMFGLVG